MYPKAQTGVSLIELVVFIVVLALGFTGLVVLYNQVTRGSVDPLVRKQAIALATSMLEEVELRGFTFCDPDDVNVYSATAAIVGAGGCTSAASKENLGPETIPPTAVEARLGTPPFDNVSDYNGFTMAGANIRDWAGNTVAGLGAYSVSVSIAQRGNDLPDVADPEDGLLISVTVTGPSEISVTLQGYRFRYAPNSP
jgi:MSHA pilin protein MshD